VRIQAEIPVEAAQQAVKQSVVFFLQLPPSALKFGSVRSRPGDQSVWEVLPVSTLLASGSMAVVAKLTEL